MLVINVFDVADTPVNVLLASPDAGPLIVWTVRRGRRSESHTE
jgi:hypothetical protein